MRFSVFGAQKRHHTWLRAIYACAVPVVIAAGLLVIAEVSLRGSGVGYPTARFVREAVGPPAVWRGNHGFVRRFFPGPWYPDIAPVQVAVPPPDGALRIAVLGESAAYGFPDPAFGFGRMLEALLAGQYPGRSVELINAAENGVTSPILLEELPSVLALKPNLLVLYIGNNEFIGPFGASNAGDGGGSPSAWDNARILASRLRLSQSEIYVGRQARPNENTPPRTRPLANDDPAVLRTHERFERNLRAMLDLAVDAGVPVVLCTVGANERDWAPFADTHRAGLSQAEQAAWAAAWTEGKERWDRGDASGALAAWKRAEAIDAEPATLAYSLAQAYAATGDATAAEAGFTRALAQDALRYRTTPAMNDRVRRLAGAYAGKGVVLADCAAVLHEASASATEGEAPLFYEYCHLAAAGNYAVAETIRAAAAPLLPATAVPAPSLPALQARLGWTPWHARESLRTVNKLIAKEPYMSRLDYGAWSARVNAQLAALDPACAPAALASALDPLQTQCAQYPADPFLARNLAQILTACGQPADAAESLQALVARYPAYDTAWELLARAETSARQHGEAAKAWRAALALRTDRSDWRAALGEALYADAQFSASRAEWKTLLAENPLNEQAWWRLGQCHEGEKDLPTAIATYREALKHLPQNVGLYYYLAKALRAHDELDAARETIAAGLAIDANHAGLKSLAAEMAAAR